ncbi:MAG: sodium:calcium antiporter [Armatimonadetes bacterium]|nr:sodium:calcium antiporter [Armatimonadota bacterium]
MLWLHFLLCSGLLVVAAMMLSRYGDVLAEKTGLGRSYIGTVVLAAATSLPELVTGTSAVVWLDAPDLAVGAIFGSCLFNLALLAVMDLAWRPGAILTEVQPGHLLSAGMGILLVGLASLGVLLGPTYSGAAGWPVGPVSLGIVILYPLCARVLHRFEHERQAKALAERAEKLEYEHIPARTAYLKFAMSVIGVFVLGVWLASLGDRIAASTGLSRGFMGTLFLAAATSLPEAVVSLAAVRMGALDLAVGNVLGSNVFNIVVLAIFDVADLRGNLWAHLSPAHTLAGLAVIVMTAVALLSQVYRVASRRPRRFGWDGGALLGIYVLAMWLLYQQRG